MHRRRSVLRPLPALFFSGLMLALIMTACGGTPTNVPDAHQLITKAQAAIQKVSSYHFNLVVDHPGTNGVFTVQKADGDILVPDKLKANANILVLGNSASVQMISVGSQQYVTDPISNQWQKTTGLLDPRNLSNSSTGVVSILGHMQNLSTPTDSSVDGTPCWSINGKLDAQYLSGITGGGAPTGSTVAVTTCIGKTDYLPYLIKMTGIAAQGDNTNTVRTFKLSKFNETLTITPPIP